MLSKQTIPNMGQSDAHLEEDCQPVPSEITQSPDFYKDVDIYQILVADLVIHHKDTLQNIPLEMALQAMRDSWLLSSTKDVIS